MSRKGGHGAYDEDDWRDDDDDYDDDDYDDDDFDAYDRGGGSATFSAKSKKKQPAPPPKATKKPPAAKQAPSKAACGSVAASEKSKEAAKAAGAAAGAAAGTAAGAAAAPKAGKPPSQQQPDAGPPLAGLSLSAAAAAAAPYSHPKELAAALSERAAAAAAAAARETANNPDKPEVHVVVLGHVDAGKSTLVGRLLADCGVVGAREAAKVAAAASRAGKGSFSWAWLLDATEDERRRGVTVEVGRCRVSTSRLHVTLLDAPGHADFVPEAIGGVAVADAALLVVDGSRGGFESGFDRSSSGGSGGGGGGGGASASPSSSSGVGGQTKEHAALARALGVRELIVAVTKLDTLGYDRDRFEEIKARLGTFLGSLGFGESPASRSSSSAELSPSSTPPPPPSRPVTWLPVSAPAGQNVSEPPTDPALLSWWGGGKGGGGGGGGGSGGTLLAALGALSPPARSVDSALRLSAADVAARPPRAGQACAVLSGKIESGALAPGMDVVAVPPGGVAGTGRVVSVVVRGGGEGSVAAAAAGAVAAPPSSSSSSSSAAVAVAGDSVEVVVSGPLAEPGVLGRGAVLCPASHPVALAKKFVARIKVLDGASGGAASAASAAAAAFVPSFSLSSSPGSAGIILPGSSVTLHVGTAVRPATITRLVALLDSRTGEEVRRRPRLVGRGQAALVEVAPEAGDAVAVVAVKEASPGPSSSASSPSSPSSSAPEPVSSLSRIALREAGKTLAVGVVVQVIE